MPRLIVPLRELLTVTLNASGNGTVNKGPSSSNQVWKISRIAVNTTGANAPYVKLYNGSVATSNFLDGTSKGNSDIAEYPNALLIHMGETITADWTGGSVGAIGTITITGEKEIE